MPKTTLALSELAGACNIRVSSGDDATAISNKISKAFNGKGTVKLSATESTLTKTNRELQLSVLADNGLSPAIVNKMVQRFCTGDLSLTENNDNSFQFAYALAQDILQMRLTKTTEKTKAQLEQEEKNRPKEWSERTKVLKPV